VQLGVSYPVPALNAPAVAHQLQLGFCGGAQAGEKVVGGLKGQLAVAAPGGCHLNDPTGADPGLGDVLRGRFGAQRPGDVATVADLVIACPERDLELSLELAAGLAVEGLLVSYSFGEDCVYDRQEVVSRLFLELPKNGRWVWSASAWISTPSRSSSPRSCRSTARSWSSPAA